LANEMAFSQSNYGILPQNKNSYFFTYLLTSHIVGELQSVAYGSVFDTITTATFADTKFQIPPQRIITKFEDSVRIYFDKQFLNTHQIHILERLRDTMLPKLMSGEVKVVV